MAIDFVAAREQLRLRADADVFEGKAIATTVGRKPRLESTGREFREYRLFNLTLLILPVYLGPALGAFDGGEVTAAAATRVGTREEVMILATRQGFDEVAAALKERGFEEDDDLLLAGNVPRPSPSFSAVGDAGGGAIVLAGSAEAAEEALRDGEPSEATTLLESVSGVARSASTRIHSDCLLGIAAGQELDPPEGQIIVRVRGEPNADSLAILLRADSAPAANNPLTRALSGLQYGEPVSSADGFLVDVRYRPKRDALGAFRVPPVASVPPVLIPQLATPGPHALTDGADAIYRCP